MIGFYDYTVILTYISAISACIGTFVSLQGKGHPYLGTLFLMICGLCDSFDGKIARLKKDRTEKEKEFGVQIDSLSDIIAFGVLPACIGVALYKQARMMPEGNLLGGIPYFVILGIGSFYVLCSLIRLAYFNITVKETQSDSLGDKKFYFGLPVTSSALIFPTLILIRHFIHPDLSFVYFILLILVGILFIIRFKLRKPSNLNIYLLILVGAVEFLAILAVRLWIKRR